MLLSRDGVTVIAADPDRDRVSIVDLIRVKVLHQVALQAGDEPGRAVQDDAGRVHVVLRGAGDIATIDVDSGTVTERRHVCNAPRGVAYDASADALHVACMTGELVSLPAAGGAPTRTLHLNPDLRDVVVHDGKLRVSEFRSATLLEIDAGGNVVGRFRPGAVTELLALGKELEFGPEPHRFASAIARRSIALPDGRTLVLHQRAMLDEVEVKSPDDVVEVPDAHAPPEPAGYGGGDSCQSIVQTAVSIVDADGNVLQSRSLSSSTLPVDVALSADGRTIAVANAGVIDPEMPAHSDNVVFGPSVGPGFGPGFGHGPRFGPGGPFGRGVGVSTLALRDDALFADEDLGESCTFGEGVLAAGQPTAVAFTSDGMLLIQSREPAMILLQSKDAMRVIELGGDSVRDTGHDLFHRDSGGGIACASCHAEGGDDGHVWQFSGLGARRTQSINVGLEGTAPFHWSGDMPDLSVLMSEVFVGRMGGIPQSPERVGALAAWMFQQQPPTTLRAADDPAVEAGRAVFENEQVGCNKCHSGEKLTNNKSEDVGTGGVFQVPSLIGIGLRAPFLHTGCAATLRERFDPQCGGDKHGDISQLTAGELDDLIAYLESL